MKFENNLILKKIYERIYNNADGSEFKIRTFTLLKKGK